MYAISFVSFGIRRRLANPSRAVFSSHQQCVYVYGQRSLCSWVR